MNATDNLISNSDDLPYQEHLEICMPSIYNQCVGIDVDFSSMRQLCRGHSCCFCPNYAERFEYCRRRGRTLSAQDAYRCCKDTSLCDLQTENGDDSDQKQAGSERTQDGAPSSGKEEVQVDDGNVLSGLRTDDERTQKAITQTRTKMESAVSDKSDAKPKEDDNSMAPPKDETVVVMTAAPSLVQPLVSVVINVSSLRDIQPTKSMQPAAVKKTEIPQDSAAARPSKALQAAVETEVSRTHKLEPTGDVNQGVDSKSSSVDKTPRIVDKEPLGDSDKAGAADSNQESSKPPPESDSATKQADKEKVDSHEASANTDNTAAKAENSGKTEGSGKTENSVKTEKTDASVKPPKSSDTGAGGLNGAGSIGATGGGGGGILSSHQKESVFMRLNNRIKSLEVNMSLSSRYLEELSQR